MESAPPPKKREPLRTPSPMAQAALSLLTPPSPSHKLKISCPLVAPEFDELLNVENTAHGRGSFSDVFVARANDKVYCLKRPKKNSMLLTWQNEAKALSLLNNPGHPRVIRFYGTWDTNGLVLDNFETDLYHAIGKISCTDQFSPLIGTTRWIEWAHGLASGLQYIHDKDIIHGDVKPNNLMVNYVNGEPTMPVIADFSCAIFDEEVGQVTSPIYSAPELQNGGHPTKKSDVYALGVVLLFCATGQEAYSEAKNTYQRLMWQQSVSPIDSYGGEDALKVRSIRGYLDQLIEQRTLAIHA